MTDRERTAKVRQAPRGAGRVERALTPFQRFAALESSGGILLLACTVIALAWANSPWADAYEALWRTPFAVGFGDAPLRKPLLLWINDGLMAVFFFVVGLEIKREVLAGELASPRRALLPIAAALGGMLAPAALYVAVNRGGEGLRGWGIPMATDIAFALGVLALLGRRVPLALKVFLAALAIIDDIGAVLVIALFYTAEISWAGLGAGAVLLALLAGANWAGVRHTLVYALLGLGLWYATLRSGVHATVAGVLLAMTIPATPRLGAPDVVARGQDLLERLREAVRRDEDPLADNAQREALESMEKVTAGAQTPLQRLEHALHPWVAYAIMPVFALANAGVRVGGDLGQAALHPVSLGVILGLAVGKQLGIGLAVWLTVRSGLARLPRAVTARHVYGAALLGGIGFTMSLFIAGLAFGDSPLLDTAKVGILIASLASGLAGLLVLSSAPPEIASRAREGDVDHPERAYPEGGSPDPS
jgi:NhaA family Na+:H+ antiporter